MFSLLEEKDAKTIFPYTLSMQQDRRRKTFLQQNAAPVSCGSTFPALIKFMSLILIQHTSSFI
jgi:hypothetical protein